jgi:hypothetical protein
MQLDREKKKEADLDNLDIGVGQQEVTSQMSSINQGLLDDQFSNGVSQSFVEID